MTDEHLTSNPLVAELRGPAARALGIRPLLLAAADEIERLTAELAKERRDHMRYFNSLTPDERRQWCLTMAQAEGDADITAGAADETTERGDPYFSLNGGPSHQHPVGDYRCAVCGIEVTTRPTVEQL